MGQTFNINGRHMTLEQAQEFYAIQRGDKKEEVTCDKKDELKKQLDELGVKYHWNAKEDTLQSLLNNLI